MAGTREGGLKAAKANLERDPDFYKKIGHIGGSAWSDKLKGFAANPALAKEAGRKGGSKTKRGFKWLGDEGNGRGRFMNKQTGEEIILEYSKKARK